MLGGEQGVWVFFFGGGGTAFKATLGRIRALNAFTVPFLWGPWGVPFCYWEPFACSLPPCALLCRLLRAPSQQRGLIKGSLDLGAPAPRHPPCLSLGKIKWEGVGGREPVCLSSLSSLRLRKEGAALCGCVTLWGGGPAAPREGEMTVGGGACVGCYSPVPTGSSSGVALP